jgi:hypothetical protein
MLVLYDTTSRQSFEHVAGWVDEIAKHYSSNPTDRPPVLLLGSLLACLPCCLAHVGLLGD